MRRVKRSLQPKQAYKSIQFCLLSFSIENTCSSSYLKPSFSEGFFSLSLGSDMSSGAEEGQWLKTCIQAEDIISLAHHCLQDVRDTHTRDYIVVLISQLSFIVLWRQTDISSCKEWRSPCNQCRPTQSFKAFYLLDLFGSPSWSTVYLQQTEAAIIIYSTELENKPGS